MADLRATWADDGRRFSFPAGVNRLALRLGDCAMLDDFLALPRDWLTRLQATLP